MRVSRERIHTKEVEDFIAHTGDDLKVSRLCHHHSDVFKIESLYFLLWEQIMETRNSN